MLTLPFHHVLLLPTCSYVTLWVGFHVVAVHVKHTFEICRIYTDELSGMSGRVRKNSRAVRSMCAGSACPLKMAKIAKFELSNRRRLQVAARGQKLQHWRNFASFGGLI